MNCVQRERNYFRVNTVVSVVQSTETRYAKRSTTLCNVLAHANMCAHLQSTFAVIYITVVAYCGSSTGTVRKLFIVPYCIRSLSNGVKALKDGQIKL